MLERLKEKYGVEVKTRPPRIAYRETVSAQGRRPSPPQEADRRRRPVRRGVPAHRAAARAAAGFEFVDEVKGGTIPGQFIPAVEKGVRQVLASGAIAGYPLQDVRVIVYDGKYHRSTARKSRSSPPARRRSWTRSPRRNPQVLEPIVDLEVTAPEQHMGDITGDLASKRARINGTDSLRGGEIVVKAQVPLSELEGYAAELKSVTAGRGRYSLDFSHYEPVPPQVQQKLVEAYKPRHEEE